MRELYRWVDSPWFSTAWLVAVLSAWVLWAWKPSLGWSLALAALPWVLRTLSGRMALRPLSVNAFLVLFLLTAGIGVWASYDRNGMQAVFDAPVGWQKLWGLALAVLLYAALATTRELSAQRRALVLLAGLGAAVAMVFIATNDWVAQPSEWTFVTRFGQALQSFLPSLPKGLLNPNVTAGITAVLLPSALGLAVTGWGERAWLRTAWGLLAGMAMALALLFTTSRGAWIAIGGALGMMVVWRLARRPGRPREHVAIFAGFILVSAMVVTLAVVGVPYLRTTALESFAFANRLNIFSQAALLVRDYPFTGSGLGMFALVHSSYALLLHVPILPHAHALFLDIAVEQGVPGALAALAVWGSAAWLGLRASSGAEESQLLLAVGLLSLAVLLIHGLVDDALYASRGLLLLWMPVGLIVTALGERAASRPPGRRWWLAAGLAAGLGLTSLAFFGRPLAAAWYANLGAVAQTLVELPQYDYNHFDNPTLDQIRQQADLSVAEAYFARALVLDPGQATAHTRLAQIALGRGEYPQALEHVQAAWDAGHHDRVTRLLLGDALASVGRVEEAASMVQGMTWATSRLNTMAWYRYWINQDWQRAAWAWRTVLALDPNDAYASTFVAQAEERAAEAP